MMILAERDWRKAPPASEASLARLRKLSLVELPQSYFALLAYSDGGEGPLPVQPLWLQLNPADVTADAIESQQLAEFFPGFIVLGSNGGGEYIALDIRALSPWPVVAIDMTNIDLNESVLPIGPCFDEFLELVGWGS
jgi:SMI1 / KNR4 family (SUKH-1)